MTITGQCDQRVGAVTHCVFESPLGGLTLVGRDDSVIGLYFPGHWYMPDRLSFGEVVR